MVFDTDDKDSDLTGGGLDKTGEGEASETSDGFDDGAGMV